jgi:hypothetical protein
VAWSPRTLLADAKTHEIAMRRDADANAQLAWLTIDKESLSDAELAKYDIIGWCG